MKADPIGVTLWLEDGARFMISWFEKCDAKIAGKFDSVPVLECVRQFRCRAGVLQFVKRRGMRIETEL